jgi:hypothetical protein
MTTTCDAHEGRTPPVAKERILENLYSSSRPFRDRSTTAASNTRHLKNEGGLTGMILWGNVAGCFPFNSIDTYAQKTSFCFQYRGYISTLIIAVYKETLCSKYSSEKID